MGKGNKKATPAPSGCQIERNGNKYTLSWKINAKNTNDGQKRRFKVGKGTWSKVKSIKKKAVKTTVEVKRDSLESVTIQVQDDQKKESKKIKNLSPSKWAGATFTFALPPRPIVSMGLSQDAWNKCVISWGHSGNAFSKTDKIKFLRTEYQTTFHDEAHKDDWSYVYKTATDVTAGNFSKKKKSLYTKSGNKYTLVGKKANYSSSTTYYKIDYKKESGSFPKVEDSEILSDGKAYVRKYQFRIFGAAGHNKEAKKKDGGWVVCSHYYSTPHAPVIKESTISQNENGGINCYLKWESDSDEFHPIDYTTVQYGVAVPNAGMTCPPDISWTDRPAMKDTGGADADSFYLDTTLNPDYCVFMRVMNTHDLNTSQSSPVMATGITTPLTIPSGLSVTPNYNTHRVSVTISNDSDVPDAKIAIVYHSTKKGKSENTIIQIINRTDSIPLTIQCPNWDNSDGWSLSAYAFVGDVKPAEDHSFIDDGTTYTYHTYEIKNIKMKSEELWYGGDVPKAPTTVEATSPREGVALVTWDWAWESADIAELSWSDHEDAWESTEQPETYRIQNTNASKWSIYGLEAGVIWYIGVRLIKTTDDGENPGPWGFAKPLDTSTIPNVPILNLSSESVTHDGTVTVSWTYESADGTDQKDAKIYNVTENQQGEPVYGAPLDVGTIGTKRSVDIVPDKLNWNTGEKHGIALEVISTMDQHSGYSPTEYITVAEPLSLSISSESFIDRAYYEFANDDELEVDDTYYTVTGTVVGNPVVEDINTYYELEDGLYHLTEDGIIDPETTYYTVAGTLVVNPVESGLPTYYNRKDIKILREMPIELTGSITGGIDETPVIVVTIKRREPYFVDRPDETTYQGFINEVVYSDTFNNITEIDINQGDISGFLDDSAKYTLSVHVYNSIGQEDEKTIDFDVDWEHQAFIPDADVEFLPEYSVVKITPTIPDPSLASPTDTFDIYRLSVDAPVLIVKGGTFGETYIDPYPTIGEFGGHRVVTITENGDFTAKEAESDMAWTDFDWEDGDVFFNDFPIVNYSGGSFEILYNADLSTTWTKDFRETRYLGGHIQGDWNAGIHRESTINSVILREEDVSSLVAFRRMAEYPGICHIRTLDGSNYYADIQVNETIPYDETPTTSYSFKVTRVDSDGYDGIELSEWNKIISG